MNFLRKKMTLSTIIKPILKGSIAENPIAGKRAQLTIVPSILIASLLVQFFDLDLTPNQLNALSTLLDSVAVLLNSYWTASTTTKVGI